MTKFDITVAAAAMPMSISGLVYAFAGCLFGLLLGSFILKKLCLVNNKNSIFLRLIRTHTFSFLSYSLGSFK